jgi:hypothetical protein
MTMIARMMSKVIILKTAKVFGRFGAELSVS